MGPTLRRASWSAALTSRYSAEAHRPGAFVAHADLSAGPGLVRARRCHRHANPRAHGPPDRRAPVRPDRDRGPQGRYRARPGTPTRTFQPDRQPRHQLPVGLHSDGLPIAIQLVGRRGEDALLLARGRALRGGAALGRAPADRSRVWTEDANVPPSRSECVRVARGRCTGEGRRADTIVLTVDASGCVVRVAVIRLSSLV